MNDTSLQAGIVPVVTMGTPSRKKHFSQARLVCKARIGKHLKSKKTFDAIITIISPRHVYIPLFTPPLRTADRPSWTCAVAESALLLQA